MPMRRENVAAALRYLQDKADLRGRLQRATSLDPQEQDLADIAVETGASLVPGVGPALAARDFERARRAGDETGMAMAAASAIPVNRLVGALKQYDPTMQKIFIGKSAKTWNQKEADRAHAMEAYGVDPETIWKETGTYRGPDGKWRQEISDVGAKGQFTHIAPSEQRLSEVAIEHPELMEAYPDLAKAQQFGLKGPKGRGSYEAMHIQTEEGPKLLGETLIVEAPTEEALAGVGIHELQHAVQRREGFQRGANPREFKNKAIPAKLKDVAFAKSMREMAIANRMRDMGYPVAEGKVLNLSRPDMIKKVKEFGEKDPNLLLLLGEHQQAAEKLKKYPDKYTQYVRSAGEVEARAAEARRMLSPEERRATFPPKSYDIPIKDIIIRKK
jgi:hypothetical protein